MDIIRKLGACALSLLGAGLLCSLALQAAEPVPAVSAMPAANISTIQVPIYKSRVLTTRAAVKKVSVGNPEIADILVTSPTQLYLLGRSLGSTNVLLWDGRNRLIDSLDLEVIHDLSGLKSKLHELLPNERIEVYSAQGALVLRGQVSSAAAVDTAVKLAKTYTAQTASVVQGEGEAAVAAPSQSLEVINLLSVGGSQQVMLEVRFAEVNRQVGKDLGVSSFFSSQGGRFQGAIGSGASVTPGADGTGVIGLDSITGSFGVFARSFGDVLGLNIDAVLDTLEEKGLSKTLAEPTLIALSGEKASFLAGGEFPIPVLQGNGGQGTGAAGGGNTGITVEFKPFGVSLGFTPTVLADNTINLLVEPEVSAIDPTASITVGGLTIPGLSTRRASTVLELRDGESFAIAGLKIGRASCRERV